MRFLEGFKTVYVNKPADTGSAGFTGESINSGLFNSIQWEMLFGTITGNSILTIKSGASDGTQTTAETFWYRLSSAAQGAASADKWGAASSSSSLTLTGTTYTTKRIQIFLDLQTITAGQPWLTLAVDATATVFFSATLCIGEPKYIQLDGSPTVI